MFTKFVEPMDCLPVAKVPEGDQWTYELKLDGYRLEVMKSKGKVTLYSKRGNDLIKRFDYIAEALKSLPDDTVVDAELVALDEQGTKGCGIKLANIVNPSALVLTLGRRH